MVKKGVWDSHLSRCPIISGCPGFISGCPEFISGCPGFIWGVLSYKFHCTLQIVVNRLPSPCQEKL